MPAQLLWSLFVSSIDAPAICSCRGQANLWWLVATMDVSSSMRILVAHKLWTTTLHLAICNEGFSGSSCLPESAVCEVPIKSQNEKGHPRRDSGTKGTNLNERHRLRTTQTLGVTRSRLVKNKMRSPQTYSSSLV